MPEIRIESLVYDYPGRRALDHVSCTIPHNSVTALVGPNGAGKTTLLRCLVGLEQPLSGHVQIGEVKVASNERAAFQRIGYLHDSFGLYSYLTVEQCLRHAAAMRGADGQNERVWVAKAAERLGLTSRLAERAGNLSRGWRQRVGIAQALVHSPDVLVLDEPASGLDPDARMHLSALVKSLQAEGVTLIVSSHILTELEGYSTHMLTLAEGRLVNFSTVTAVSNNMVRIRVELAAPHATWPALDGVEVAVSAPLYAELLTMDEPEAQAALLERLIMAGARVRHFAVLHESMEDRYKRLVVGSRGVEK
jgi:ABC-2 type transport system ATP-binding protein